MNLRLVKTVLMYNYILLNVMIHSTSIFKIQPCKILNFKKKSLASTEDYYSLSKDTIYQFFSCVAKFAKMDEICKIFNLRQVFFLRFEKFHIENNTGYDFCVLNNLQFQSDHKKSENCWLYNIHAAPLDAF